MVGAYEYVGGGQSFCAKHFVRLKVCIYPTNSTRVPLFFSAKNALQAMEEIHKLRAQISNIVRINFTDTDDGLNPKLPPPRDIQVRSPRHRLVEMERLVISTIDSCVYCVNLSRHLLSIKSQCARN